MSGGNQRRFKAMKNNITYILNKQDRTQTDLAYDVGIWRGNINEIIHGKRRPGIILALKIAESLGERVENVFVLDDQDWD